MGNKTHKFCCSQSCHSWRGRSGLGSSSLGRGNRIRDTGNKMINGWFIKKEVNLSCECWVQPFILKRGSGRRPFVTESRPGKARFSQKSSILGPPLCYFSSQQFFWSTTKKMFSKLRRPGESRIKSQFSDFSICFCGSQRKWINCTCGGFSLGPGMMFCCKAAKHNWIWPNPPIMAIKVKKVTRIPVSA